MNEEFYIGQIVTTTSGDWKGKPLVVESINCATSHPVITVQEASGKKGKYYANNLIPYKIDQLEIGDQVTPIKGVWQGQKLVVVSINDKNQTAKVRNPHTKEETPHSISNLVPVTNTDQDNVLPLISSEHQLLLHGLLQLPYEVRILWHSTAQGPGYHVGYGSQDLKKIVSSGLVQDKPDEIFISSVWIPESYLEEKLVRTRE